MGSAIGFSRRQHGLDARLSRPEALGSRSGTRSRWRRAAAAALILLALVPGLACGDSEATGGSAPGFDDTAPTTLDEPPFSLAQPTTTAGPTTTPASTEGSTTPGSSEPPDLAGPTTTTTLVPNVPPTDSITSICGFVESTQSLGALPTDPSIDAQPLAEGFLENVDRYVEVAPGSALGDLEALRPQLQSLVGILRDAEWDASAPQFLAAVGHINARQPPYEGFLARLDRVQAVEEAICS